MVKVKNTTYAKSNRTGAVQNRDQNGYKSRLVKRQAEKVKAQEIKTMSTEIAELRKLINGLQKGAE